MEKQRESSCIYIPIDIIYMKAYPSSDGLCMYGMNLVDCGNSDVYNSQEVIKIKRKNDSQF